MKTLKTISINGDVWNEAQKHYPNELSSRIEEFLRMIVAKKTGNYTDVDINLLYKKRDENAAKLGEISAKQAEILQNISKIEQNRAEIEQKNLQKEREKQEKALKCSLCGGEIQGEPIKIQQKKICMSCFRGNSAEFLAVFARKEDVLQDFNPVPQETEVKKEVQNGETD